MAELLRKFLKRGPKPRRRWQRKAGHTDTHSQFQRALGCLGVSHLVAKDPQSKGKIERQFGFWQKRIPALMRVESMSDRRQANELLAAQIDWHHDNHVSRSTGMTPRQAVEQSLARGDASWRRPRRANSSTSTSPSTTPGSSRKPERSASWACAGR